MRVLRNGSRKCAHGLDLFWQASTHFSKIKSVWKGLAKNRRLRIKNLGNFLKIPTFYNTEIFSGKPNKFGNLYRCVCKISFRKGGYKLEFWNWYWRHLGNKRGSSRIFLTRSKQKNFPMVRRSKGPSQNDKFLWSFIRLYCS